MTHHRAEPLPADDRRRAIIDAVIPLLLEKGSAVTSRQMAEAAGVAEGTIFRVFPDKASVIAGAIKASMDPTPIQAALAQIPTDDPLEAQLETAANVLLDWSGRVGTLFGVLRTVGPPSTKHRSGGRRIFRESNEAILAGLTTMFQPHEGHLGVPAARAALAFRALTFASAHPMSDEALTASEIASILLNGIVRGQD